MNKNIQVCKRCVMDNKSDDTITFDSNGYCNYCTEALNILPYSYFPNQEGQDKINKMISDLKEKNADKKYDCLMGISGGLDSSYLAYLGAKEWGLRILAVHIDDGFDEPLAVRNITKLCKACEIDLVNVKPDADQFYDLTRSFLLAEVPNLAIPQDNILFSCLYRLAREYDVNTFLSGTNFSLECILQKGNTHDSSDATHIKDIHNKFGKKDINNLSLLSAKQKVLNKYIYKIETIRPLNYIDYNKDKAISKLEEFCGFQYYDSKHLENTLTKFIQLYWFYHKFNVDKRTSHLSSLIVSGQMTRDEALTELEKELYDKDAMERDIEFIISKIGITREELDLIISRPGKQHNYYKTSNINKYANILNNKIKNLKK